MIIQKTMKLIDTHAHLQSNIFSKNLPNILKSASENNVQSIINCSTNTNDMDKVYELSKAFNIIIPAAGIHPWYIPENIKDFLKQDFSFLEKFHCLGEIGLDKKYSTFPLELQIQTFEYFLKAAVDLNKAATIHCIGAYDELIASIKKIGTPENGIVIHSFNGSMELARSLSKFNIFFSIGGTSTYPKNIKRNKMINYIYPELMMLETDSPDIIPFQIQDSYNQPSNIVYILEAVAQICSKSEDEIAKNTTNLAKKIFSL